jgi:hypothetical protein
VWFDDDRGFAVGHNPKAAAPFVCWQFTTENGKREFYWGAYCNTEKEAQANLIARTIVHASDGHAWTTPTHLAAVEMSTEQNYNMIDGLRNNMATPRADLTDGQTHGEMAELAPHTLPPEKPSVMDKIREARKAPPAPRKDKSPEQKKQKGEPVL